MNPNAKFDEKIDYYYIHLRNLFLLKSDPK